MKFMSFLRFFGKRWLRGKTRRQRLTPRPDRATLLLESLETRVMLSTAPPTIINVTPADNSTVTVLSPQPTISVTYSEPMAGVNANGAIPGTGAADPNNYLLVDASGGTITISSATLDATDTVVTLGYNGGNPLPANTYTLFVRGNNLVDKATAIPLAPLAQAFIANDAQNNVSVVNLEPDGTLGASSNYPVPNPGTPAGPWAVSHADLNGDGFPDLIIADDTTEQLLIFAGRPTSAGGGFNITPDLTLQLNRATSANPGKSIIVDDFTDFKPYTLPKIDVRPDIAVANADSNTVQVFHNNRSLNSIGTLSFTQSANVDLSTIAARQWFITPSGLLASRAATLTSPTGIVGGDIDNDGYQDITVVNGYAGAAAGTPSFITTFINQLNGNTHGFFDNKRPHFQEFTVGNIGDPNNKPIIIPSGVTQVSSIALGDFNGDGLPDLAVGGANGVGILTNTSTPGVADFDGSFPVEFPFEPVALPNDPVASLAIGPFSKTGPSGAADIFRSGTNDIVAALYSVPTFPGTGSAIAVLANDGTGGFSASLTPSTLDLQVTLNKTGSTQGSAIKLADLNGDGFNDVIVTDGHSTAPLPAPGNLGNVFIFENTTGDAAGLKLFANDPNIPNFVPGLNSDYNVDGSPFGVDVLDTSNDGIPGILPISVPNPLPPVQLVTANNQGDKNPTTNVALGDFTLYLSNGDGTFRVATILPIDPNQQTPLTSIAVGDLNSDGIPDIVVLNNTGTSQQTKVGVMLGLGNSKYTAPFFYSVSNAFNNVVDVKIGALHTGKNPDILLVSEGQALVEVLTNNLMNGATTLDAASFTTGTPVKVGTAPTQAVIGDFNNDGNLDVAVSHDSSGGPNSNRGVTLLLGNGDGTFQAGFEVVQAAGVNAGSLAEADFNKDGNLDLVVADDPPQGGPISLRLLYGDGKGNFRLGGTFATGVAIPTNGSGQADLAVADVNNDGYVDVAVSSPSPVKTAGGVSVLINQLGTGFGPPIRTNLITGTPVQTISFNDVNQDGSADLIATTQGGTFPADNAFLLVGNGDGSFGQPVPYLAAQNGIPTPVPSFLVTTPSPLLRATTFVQGGNFIVGNLVSNNGFEKADLSSEAGNLDGWQTFRELNPNTGSHGAWSPQTGLASPLSGVPVPLPPRGSYQAMLDQADLQPFPTGAANPNFPADYAGTNVLYQDITIPITATRLDLSISLYLNSFANFSDGAVNPTLDYQTTAANQQVRVDLMDPNGPILGYTFGSDPKTGGLLFSAYQSQAVDPTTGFVTRNKSTDPTSPDYDQNFAALLPQLRGTTVRLRIVGVNNQGKLIVGVDQVRLNATFNDTTVPFFTNSLQAHLRNVSFVDSNGIPFTTDPTIVGQVGDKGSVNNIYYVAFDPYNTGFTGQQVYKILTLDPQGNFTFTIPSLLPGVYTVNFEVVSRASDPITGIPLKTTQTITFGLQGPSVSQFEATGPNGISVSGQPSVDYTSVSGRVTAIATDPGDLSGNTYYVGSANGGIWKTTDGGSSWKPLTDYLTDGQGNPIQTAIGAMAVAPTSSQTIYAGTGVADLLPDSRPGIGILRSFDGGATWKLVGNATGSNVTNLIGARISKIVVDNNNSQILYAAVASGGSKGPGVYKSTDGGNTWTNVLVPTAMFLAAGGTLPSGTALASVTDLVIDPFDASHLLVGMGNMGLLAASASAGVWTTGNSGGTWFQVVGGDGGIANSTLPTGVTLGRVSLAISPVRVANESVIYVLIANPPGNNVAPNVDQGKVDQIGPSGLYKTSNNLLDFTKVKLRQNTAGAVAPNFQDIGLGVEGSNAYGLAVDLANPNVVYVGGSQIFQNFAANPTLLLQHSLIRVDTGDMRDARTVVGGLIPNDGDDIVKAAYGAAGNTYPGGGAYQTEGVYWFDIVDDASSPSTATSANRVPDLPPDIHALTFDAQGRLLIGTNGGIWRGVDRGFSYDFGSGGTGIYTPGNAFSTPGMSVTAINGNLQITGLTSVAIDPSTAGTFYTTQFGTGSAVSSTILSWVSAGVTGPTFLPPLPPNLPPNSKGNLLIPNADVVLAAPPDPNAAPNTPSTLYRMWQYADQQGVVPEKSTNGGNTWAVINNGIPISNNPAGVFPALAIASDLVFNGGQYFNQLLLGTQEVFLTRTNGNAWTQISSPLTTNPAEFITALAIGNPATPHAPATFFYAGTNLGQVFVTKNAGTDNWPSRSSGLPAAAINYIAVDNGDPNPSTYIAPNPMHAIVAFGPPNAGSAPFSHVFETTNGGTSWKNISGNLPKVNANAVVFDPRPALNAPNGKIYVATDVGVYVTINDGVSWVRVGNSLPNAPVVDLAFSSSQDVLAAAAQGRGVFSISTAKISPIGDQIIFANTTSNVIPFSINAVGVAQGSFTVNVSSSNQAIIPNGNIVVGGTSDTERNLTITPATDANTYASGPVTITITLTDSFGQKFTESFLVTVLANLVIDANSSVSFLIGVPDTSNVSATSSNQVIIPNTNIIVTNGPAGERSIKITPAINQVGSLTVTLTITDSSGVQQSYEIPVLVKTNVIVLPFTDDFNRPDNTFLGTAWSVLSSSGTIDVAKNAALVTRGVAPNGASVAVLNGVVRSDVTLDVDVTLAVGQSAGLIARQSGAADTNLYLATLTRTSSGYLAGIYRLFGGKGQVLASTDVTGFAGVGIPTIPGDTTETTTTLRFEVVGDSLKLYVSTGATRALAAFANDTWFASGAVGIRGTAGSIFDNFAANDLPVAATKLPFLDDFSTTGSANQLSTNWEDRAGNFAVQSGAAVGSVFTGNTGADLSILRGGSYGDVVVSADVNVDLGQNAGLVARYQGFGDDTMYLGVLDNTTGTPVAEIFRSTGPGKFDLLNSAAASGNAGTLHFAAIGDSLQLFLDNTLLTFASDSVLTTGSVGIRGSVTSFDNFNATAAPANKVALGFTDDFINTAQPNGQPQAAWLIRQGDYQLNGTAAVGQDPTPTDQSFNNPSRVNLAVLNGINAADVNVSENMNVAFGEQVGLVARYQNDNNFYLGVLDFTGVSALAEIWTNVGGNWTELGSAIASNVGNLQFTVVGGLLMLGIDGTVLVSARDYFLTTGTVGIRSSASPLNNFAVTAATSTLPYSDNFATPGPLGSAWSVDAGLFSASGTTADGGTTGTNLATLPAVNTADVIVSADVSLTAGNHAGLVARYSGPGDSNMYLGVLNDSSGTPLAQIYVNFGGTFFLLGSANATAASGTLQFQVVGSSLRLFLDGTLQVAVRDTNLAIGTVGIRGSNTSFANFSAQAAPAVLPFSDNFNSGTSLSSAWLTEAGSFSVAGAATGQTAVNLASLPGANAADVDVTANISVGPGKQAGLIARHSALGDTNYYLGVISNTGGPPTAQIISKVGATTTVLATATASASTGVLRFEVVGNSLRLFLDNVLQVETADKALSTGSVGIRGSQTSFDNFSAAVATPTAVGLPFNDGLSAGNAQGELQDFWSIRNGDFTVTGGVTSGANANNLAVLGGISAADVTVSVNVSVAAGQQAGVVARYSGVADDSMYLGVLDNSTGTPMVQIIRISASGQKTVLAQAKSPGSIGTLTLQVTGSALRLSVNGSVIVDATDIVPLVAGTVGIRGSQTTFANFSAS